MEVAHAGEDSIDLVLGGQEGGAEVEGALGLAEARAWHHLQTGVLEETQAVPGRVWQERVRGKTEEAG